MGDVTVAEGTPQLTLRAADEIRDLIVRRVLLPGEKIRQVELANRVGVSRRAKKLVVLAGSRRALAAAVRTKGAGRRHTALTHRLQPAAQRVP
jgi:Bacterial regulatory proteins, gntR family